MHCLCSTQRSPPLQYQKKISVSRWTAEPPTNQCFLFLSVSISLSLSAEQVQDLAIRCVQKNIKKNRGVKDWPWWKLFTNVRPLVEVQLSEEQLRGKDVSLFTFLPACLFVYPSTISASHSLLASVSSPGLRAQIKSFFLRYPSPILTY